MSHHDPNHCKCDRPPFGGRALRCALCFGCLLVILVSLLLANLPPWVFPPFDSRLLDAPWFVWLAASWFTLAFLIAWGRPWRTACAVAAVVLLHGACLSLCFTLAMTKMAVNQLCNHPELTSVDANSWEEKPLPSLFERVLSDVKEMLGPWREQGESRRTTRLEHAVESSHWRVRKEFVSMLLEDAHGVKK